jgi:hypothetical protein
LNSSGLKATPLDLRRCQYVFDIIERGEVMLDETILHAPDRLADLRILLTLNQKASG